MYVSGERGDGLQGEDITTNIVEEILVGSTEAGLEGYNSLNQRFSFIKFNNCPHKINFFRVLFLTHHILSFFFS